MRSMACGAALRRVFPAGNILLPDSAVFGATFYALKIVSWKLWLQPCMVAPIETLYFVFILLIITYNNLCVT